jgi:hypothetical protein
LAALPALARVEVQVELRGGACGAGGRRRGLGLRSLATPGRTYRHGPGPLRPGRPEDRRRRPEVLPEAVGQFVQFGQLPRGGPAGGVAVKMFSHTDNAPCARRGHKGVVEVERGSAVWALDDHGRTRNASSRPVGARGLRSRFRRCRQAGDSARRSPCRSRR